MTVYLILAILVILVREIMNLENFDVLVLGGLWTLVRTLVNVVGIPEGNALGRKWLGIEEIIGLYLVFESQGLENAEKVFLR